MIGITNLTESQIETLTELILGLDLDELIETVREIAREHPDIIYYRHIHRGELVPKYIVTSALDELSGGCIIGQAMIRMGRDIEDIALLDLPSESDIVSLFTFASTTDKNEFFVSDDRRIRWLGHVQLLQDKLDGPERTWSEVIDETDSLIPLDTVNN